MKYTSQFLMLLVLCVSLVTQAAPDYVFGLYGEPSEEAPCRAGFAPVDGKWAAMSVDDTDHEEVAALVAAHAAPHQGAYTEYFIPKATKLRKKGFFHGMKVVDPKTGKIVGWVMLDRMPRADGSADKGRISILENYVRIGVMTGPEKDAPVEENFGQFTRIGGKGLAEVRLFLDPSFNNAAPGSHIDNLSSIMQGVLAYMKCLSTKAHPLHLYPKDRETGSVHAVMSYTVPADKHLYGGFERAGFTEGVLDQSATPGYFLDHTPPEGAEALAEYEAKKAELAAMRTMYALMQDVPEDTMVEKSDEMGALLAQIAALKAS